MKTVTLAILAACLLAIGVGIWAMQALSPHAPPPPIVVSFSETGNLVRDNPGAPPGVWQLVYEKPGAPALTVSLDFSGFASTTLVQGARVHVWGTLLGSTVHVLSLTAASSSSPQR